MQTNNSLLDPLLNNLPTGAMLIRGSDICILLLSPACYLSLNPPGTNV